MRAGPLVANEQLVEFFAAQFRALLLRVLDEFFEPFPLGAMGDYVGVEGAHIINGSAPTVFFVDTRSRNDSHGDPHGRLYVI